MVAAGAADLSGDRAQAVGGVREALGDKDRLTGDFTANLLMTTVLRIIRHTDELDAFPELAAYKARCEERPAFQRALTDQMAAFATPT